MAGFGVDLATHAEETGDGFACLEPRAICVVELLASHFLRV